MLQTALEQRPIPPGTRPAGQTSGHTYVAPHLLVLQGTFTKARLKSVDFQLLSRFQLAMLLAPSGEMNVRPSLAIYSPHILLIALVGVLGGIAQQPAHGACGDYLLDSRHVMAAANSMQPGADSAEDRPLETPIPPQSKCSSGQCHNGLPPTTPVAPIRDRLTPEQVAFLLSGRVPEQIPSQYFFDSPRVDHSLVVSGSIFRPPRLGNANWLS